ncbi:S-layer family protein [Tumebacillus sp. BK434]|uniref:S-layer homology domain-containing protein n=1 Tax=Tumebacillus sp. BK434 TaxID=2512169 RepID=UPI00104A56CE|nr:S-layer homology domain-containing protein [Tumebacillus sp. BK434]TCP58185.1 S-layer family protein [Tumebacillus sp. BK434]
MGTFSKVLTSVLLATTIAGITATTASANFFDTGKIAPWAYDAVLQARNSGIMQGGTDNHFRPLDAITRQETAAILVQLLKLDTPASTQITFRDVKATDWGWKQIEAVKKAGVMLGDGAQFRPYDKITREELAVLLVKAAGIDPSAANTLTVADHNKISAWAKAYVQTAIEKKLMRGDGTNFNPQSQATRQEVAVMAANFTALVEASAPKPEDPTTPQPEPGTDPSSTQPAAGEAGELSVLNGVIRDSKSDLLPATLQEEGFLHVSSVAATRDAYLNQLHNKQTAAGRDLTRTEIQQIIDAVNAALIGEVPSANDPAELAAALTRVEAALDAKDSAALLRALQGMSGLPTVHPKFADDYLSELAMEREFAHDAALNKSIIARVIEATNISLASY